VAHGQVFMKFCRPFFIGTIYYENNSRPFFIQLDKVMKDELKMLKRNKEKLFIKNGVLLNQRIKISEQIKQLQAVAEVISNFLLICSFVA
jgi:hypothetical protein